MMSDYVKPSDMDKITDKLDQEAAKEFSVDIGTVGKLELDKVMLQHLDGRGDEAAAPAEARNQATKEATNEGMTPTNTRPHHKYYLDREFLLYLRDSPHCKTFPKHIFHDLTVPVISKDRLTRAAMTRAELEREAKTIMTDINDANVSYCVRRLNSFALSDTAEANLIGEIVFERAMDHPKLVGRVCSDLSPHLFNTIIRQCVQELDLDRGFEDVRTALNGEMQRGENGKRQHVVNELLQKEKTLKRRFASAAVFVAEMFGLGAPVKTKLMYSITYKLLNLWQTKKEELFVQVLCTVLCAAMWQMKERCDAVNQPHRVQGLIIQLREVATDPSTPERVRVILNEAMNARRPRAALPGPVGIPAGMPPHLQAIFGARPMHPAVGYGYPGFSFGMPSFAPAYPGVPFGLPSPQRFMWYRPLGPMIPYARTFVPPPPPILRPALGPNPQANGANQQRRENNQPRGERNGNANHVQRMTGLFDKMMGELQKMCVPPEKERKRHISL